MLDVTGWGVGDRIIVDMTLDIRNSCDCRDQKYNREKKYQSRRKFIFFTLQPCAWMVRNGKDLEWEMSEKYATASPNSIEHDEIVFRNF